jgi:tRNA acetyltransferase TAN1
LVVAKTMLNPLTVVKELRKMLKNQPEEFRYMLRVVPVEAVVSTKLEDIKKASLDVSARIGEDETFRVTVEKRHTTLSSKEIVKAVAEGIDRKVDLLKPNKIVLIEVLGGLTGVSVIEPDDILSVVKEKSQLNLSG